MKRILIIILFLFFSMISGYSYKYKINFYFFESSKCNKCFKIKYILFPYLEKKLNIILNYKDYDILNEKNFEILLKIRNYLNITNKDIPVIIINKTYIAGFDNINKNFEPIIKRFKQKRVKTEFLDLENISKKNISLNNITFFSILVAGLLDGVNPCAFATLIFLISYLTYLKKRDKIILLIGIFYTAGVFITYFLIGIGFFQLVEFIYKFNFIKKYILWILSFMLIILSIISFKDFFNLINKKNKKVVLQLPLNIKLKIHKIIRTKLKDKSLLFSSFFIGFFVSIFELSCTGQIYFPTIVYMTGKGYIEGYILLFVYNIMFVLPLILIFFIFYKFNNFKNISDFFKKRVAIFKLLIGILFLFLAILIFKNS